MGQTHSNQTVVINVVGLTPDLVDERTPFLKRWFDKGRMTSVHSMLPAVTCSVQATYLTGKSPSQHGIVGNGWYFRDLDMIKFWRQSNRLIQAPKLWETLKNLDPQSTSANLFWWYNMNSSVDYLITPRPIYRADGVKIPDILTYPMELRNELQDQLGQFPLFEFWGPATTIRSSDWIARSARLLTKSYDPTLTLVYLPHLDYNLQRIGPDDPTIATDLKEIDQVCEELVDWYESRGAAVVILSEYGIEPVSKPVHLNRVLRKEGCIAVREEMGGEILIPGASQAFAVADHQIAHIYVKNSRDVERIRSLIEGCDGVDRVLGESEKADAGLDHERSGDLIAVAEPDAWFTYYYWLEESKAPDFAPTVDIHNKPGYDPAELLIDPSIRFPRLKAARRLLQKRLGFRYKMDLIPIIAEGVRGSHGRLSPTPGKGPLIGSNRPELIPEGPISATDVHDVLLSHLTGNLYSTV